MSTSRGTLRNPLPSNRDEPSEFDRLARIALAAAGQIAYRLDRRAERIVLTGAVTSLAGLRTESAALTLDDWLALIHRDDRVRYRRQLYLDRRPDLQHVVQYRIARDDGTVVYCEDSGERETGSDAADADIIVGLISSLAQVPPAVRDIGESLVFAEHLPDLVSLHASDGRCLYMNRAGRRQLGISQSEKLERLALDDIIADSVSTPRHLLLPIVMSNGTHTADVWIRDVRGDGRVPASWSGVRIEKVEGGGACVLGVARDLSSQQEMAHTLDRQQKRLAHALDLSGIAEFSIDMERRTPLRSKRLAEIFGIRPGLASWSYDVFLDHVHAQDRDRVDAAIRRSLVTGDELYFETRILRRDGERRWISIKATAGRAGSPRRRHIAGVVQDITERRFVEQRDRFLANVSVPLNRLVDDRHLLDQVARHIVPFLADHVTIDLVDRQSHLTRAVATSSLLSAAALDSRQGSPFRQSTGVERLLASGEPVLIERTVRRTLRPFAIDESEYLSLEALGVTAYLGVPLVLHQRPLGVMHLYRCDVDGHYGRADLELAQELARRLAVALENARLYRAVRERDARKDEFLAMLSHELRNPIEAIGSGLELLDAEDEPDEQEWARRMMQGQVDRLAAVLEDLLDTSRYTFGKIALQRRRVAVRDLIDRAVFDRRRQMQSAGYRLVVDLDPATRDVSVDGSRIAQVLDNLLTNALRYGAGRGIIRLTGRAAGDFVEIAVSDEGRGLAPEHLERVFELFSQLDTTFDRGHGGLGMGLTLVKRIVELHGGTVRAESEGLDRGSTFSITLPIDESDRVVEASRDEQQRPLTVSARRLLLVDDNLESVSALEKLFMRKGYEVRAVHNGLDAIDEARRYRPHCAVVDIGLPGADGYQVAEALRQMNELTGLRLVALSGYGRPRDRERSRQAGFDVHLVKPISFRVLVEHLNAS